MLHSYYIDSTLPSTEVLCALTDVQDWSSDRLYLNLQFPYSVEQETCKQTREHKKMLLKRWFKEHPTPSMALTEALYQMGEHEILNRVKRFIPGTLGSGVMKVQ